MLRVHHLNCSTLCTPGARWLLGPGNGGCLVCHCLLIETDAGLCLVDTGFGLKDVADPVARMGRMSRFLLGPHLLREETAAHQIEALGFKRDDVKHIILTHLDLDHAGGLADFPQAKVHLMAAEHALTTQALKGRARQRYKTNTWAHGPDFRPYTPAGEAWHGFECVRDLDGLPDEILLVPLDGHSVGHAAVAVRAEGDWLLHAGDAYFHRAEMTPTQMAPRSLRFFQRANAWDRKRADANRERLRQLALDADHPVRVFCAHDPVEFKRYRASSVSGSSPSGADAAR